MDSTASQTIIGLDIGGTKTAVVEGSAQAEILRREEIATEATRPFDETFPQIADLVRRTIEAARRSNREVIAVSVSIGGPLKIAEGVLIDPPHLPGWRGVRLKERLTKAFQNLPVLVEHDGNAGALAEFHFGAGKGREDLRHLVFLTFGTGLGAGLIINGQVLRGATDTAGEVGHLRLAWEGPALPVGFGKAGSWEGFASGEGLVGLASRMFPGRWSRETPIRDVVAAMLADDPQALEVAAEAGKWMGRGMALLVDTLNPQIITLGSLAVALGERVLAPARRAVAEEALPQAVAACEIVPAKLGRKIGDVAALMAALTDDAVRARLGLE
ncbi:MAG TPA: ROK family protein [Blastocatellia bacterium]|nr:ROK family protein [Blastocatellia bacterium]